MHFVAIDLGASFIKSALVDTGSSTISQIERVPFPPFANNLPDGYREIPVEDILQIAKQQIDRLLALAPDCAGIVSCGQMHGLVLTDGQGRPLTNFISWMDERALLPYLSGNGSYLETLTSKVAPPNGINPVTEIRAGSTIAILFWLQATQGIPKGAIPYSLSDFVISRLAKSEPKCEPTMASGFGVLDVFNGRWHQPSIDKLGLGHLQWPKIARYGEPIGNYPSGAKQIPVYASLGDQQCALLGSLLKPGELSINVATGSQVSMVRDVFERGPYQIRPYFDGLFLNTMTHLPAGRAFNKLIESQGLASKDPWRAIEEAATAADSTRGRLFRAVFENMADNYYAAAKKLDPDITCKTLVFSGGLITKSPLLQQLITKRFGLSIRPVPSQEDTLLGLLVLSIALSGQSTTLLQAMEAPLQASPPIRQFQ